MKRQHPKEAAANRGCLSARHWSDIRQAMRLTRSEGGVLILHGVKVLPSDDAASESLLQSFQPAKNATRDARKPPQTEAVTEAGASTSKRLHAQQRSAQRLADYNEAKRAAACGARWQPIVQTVLSRSRAKQRAEVWTSWMRSKKEARAKLCATSSCVSGDARSSSTRCRSRHLQARAGSVCPPATTFSPHCRTATGISSTVPRTSSPLRHLTPEELTSARGPGYASRTLTPTPISTSRTTA